MIRLLYCLFLMLVMIEQCDAQAVSAKGMGTVTYSFRLNAEDRRDAVQRASLNALEAYVAESSQAKVRLFSERREQFAAQLERFVIASTVLSEDVNKDAKTFTVVIRADINATQVQAELNASSAVQNTAAAERSMLTFIFVARAQGSSQKFDDKVYKRTDTHDTSGKKDGHSEKTSEGEHVSAASISTSASRVASNTAVTDTSVTSITGGSTTSKADIVSWVVTSAAEVNTAMSGIFSNAGYEVIEAEFVEGESDGQLSVAKIRSEFSTGNDLSSELLRATVSGIRTAGIPLMAFGTLDVGMQDIDPVSGNVRIPVTVTGKVLDVSGRFPKTITSVGPVLYFGLGSDASVAKTNALSLAAEKTAGQMVDELNVKNQH